VEVRVFSTAYLPPASLFCAAGAPALTAAERAFLARNAQIEIVQQDMARSAEWRGMASRHLPRSLIREFAATDIPASGKTRQKSLNSGGKPAADYFDIILAAWSLRC
jgi:hypothetical protein